MTPENKAGVTRACQYASSFTLKAMLAKAVDEIATAKARLEQAQREYDHASEVLKIVQAEARRKGLLEDNEE